MLHVPYSCYISSFPYIHIVVKPCFSLAIAFAWKYTLTNKRPYYKYIDVYDGLWLSCLCSVTLRLLPVLFGPWKNTLDCVYWPDMEYVRLACTQKEADGLRRTPISDCVTHRLWLLIGVLMVRFLSTVYTNQNSETPFFFFFNWSLSWSVGTLVLLGAIFLSLFDASVSACTIVMGMERQRWIITE